MVKLQWFIFIKSGNSVPWQQNLVLYKIKNSFFLFQNIHSEMYSLLIETYIEDSAEK